MTTGETSLRQCIEDLSLKNTDYKFPEQAINQAESLKSLSSDLYTDNIRFIYELMQNADDAQAKNILLTILDNKYFIITHDGNIFDEKDLHGLCGINNGTKKKDLDKTGYKGLGFKSVFGKSNYVLIYSNGEYFRFDSSYQIKWKEEWGTMDQSIWEQINDRQFIYPWQINPIWTNNKEIPNVIINFLHSKRKQIHVGYAILLNNTEEIHSAMSQLKQQPSMFLFLRNISQLTFLTESNDVISIDRNMSHDLKKVCINKKVDSQWIIKRFQFDIPDDIRDQLSQDTKAPEKLGFIKQAEMFFAAKYKTPVYDQNGDLISGGIEKLREQDSILFSYLPTKISEYKFPVLINANFLTNVNREQIHTDSIWNQWLFEKIGSEIFQWIKELVTDNKFHFQAYRLIPSKLNLTNNILSKRFNDSFLMTIKHCNFIRNRKNPLLKVDEVIMDSTCISRQSSFIDLDSMRQYLIHNERKPSHYADNPFIQYDSNLNQIGVKEFTWNQCIDMFRSEIFLKTHSIDHNKRMIEYFYTKCPNLETADRIGISLKDIPFVMDQNNRLQLTKEIYFPAETIGDSGTIDSEDLFVHETIFHWLNEKSQKGIKQWLKDMGVEERTDLTYLRKTVIPNADAYITLENAIKTMKMLFMLFQKNTITKKELDDLKKLKILTTRGTLVAAEQCFFSDQYKPRSQIEEYLTTKVDRFVSFDYVTDYNSKKENEELTEWRRFFTALGVQEELHPIIFNRRLTSYEAAGYEFVDKYLSTTSPNGKHTVDAFSGLTTITFMQYTKNNYDFAKFFWSYVIKNIPPDILTQKIKIYWGHSNKQGAIDGTLLDDADYISWFVKNIKYIPTTEKTCEFSSDILTDTKELKELCGKYMYFSSISLPQEKTNWNEIFHFKTKLTPDDYFDLLEKIRHDEKYFKDNLDRIQTIYFHLLKEMYYWSSDEQKLAKTRVKSLHLLTENDQWKLASDLYLYMEGNGTNHSLNDAIPCLKLDYKNRNHPHLNQFLELFNIKQIKMNDLKLADKQSSPAEYFRRKLIEISPFLKKWLKHVSVSSEIISSIDRKIQQEYAFIESNRLQLFYHQNFVQETNVYFDHKDKQLYVTRPWDSETTFINLPNKLCQLLNISGFEKNIRFLLKGTIEEIEKHFTTNSIEIPTNKDIVILETLSRANVLKQAKSSVLEPDKATSSINNKETSRNKHENTAASTETFISNSKNPRNNNDSLLALQPAYQIVPQYYPFPFYDSSQVPVQIPFQEMRPPREDWRKTSTSVFMEPEGEQVDNIELINVSSIVTANSALFQSLSDVTGEGDEFDLYTGRIGEEMVYKYLLKEHRGHANPVTIKWLNQNRESQLPYDIILTKNGKTHYIEVKSTRTYNQHIFPLSIHQIETFLQQRENYFIYRVYIDEKKLVILDNIRWRLIQKQQLACLLRIIPISLDQTLLTND